MKFRYLFILLPIITLNFMACEKQVPDVTEEVDFKYHAHIHAPTNTTKHMGDTLVLNIEFESHSGVAVHHVNVRIYKKADQTEIYDAPEEAHVHAMEGKYIFKDEIAITPENGMEGHTDWVLEARVWGHKLGQGEVVATQEFHIHP